MLLDWQKTKELLEKYQIPTVESLIVEDVNSAFGFAKRVGFPVVLKLISENSLHKIDKGLVKLNIKNKQELETSCRELRSLHLQGAKLPAQVVSLPANELILQKQIKGVEVFLGMKRDESFGPVVSFGLGGIFVEVLKDISFGICPVDKEYAFKIIKAIKGLEVLFGFRGQSLVDVGKIASMIVSLSKLAIENNQFKEIDFNPAIANEEGVFAVDPKFVL